MLDKMLVKDCIKLNLNAKNKIEVIDELVDVLYNAGRLNDKDEFRKTILNREEQSSTGLEEGIAIPHARSEKIEEIVVTVGLVENKIDFNSPDGEGVNLILLVGAPKGKNREYLSLVSELMRTFRNKKLREAVTCASNYQELLEAIAELK